jgi:hypothetical protein
MEVVVIGRGNVDPSSAENSPHQAHGSNKLRRRGARPCREKIPQTDKRKTRPGCDRNEDLENRTFGIAVSDSS